MSRAVTSLDLLEERRQELGLAPPQRRPLRLLVLRGAAVAAVMTVGVVATGLVVTLATAAWSQRLAALAEATQDHDRLAARLQGTRQRTEELRRSSLALAEALVNVRSSSALLSELAVLTPRGVQLKTLSVVLNAITLEGEAVNWQVVNLLQLRLQSSPFFQSGGEVAIKGTAKALVADQEAAGADDAAVTFQLTATFAADAMERIRPILGDLGASGLAQRVRLMEARGLLHPTTDEE